LQEVYIDQFDTLDEALAKALQDDCNEWDTGIQIIAIRVTKVLLPHSLLFQLLIAKTFYSQFLAPHSRCCSPKLRTSRRAKDEIDDCPAGASCAQI
jgi:hypothetical protein